MILSLTMKGLLRIQFLLLLLLMLLLLLLLRLGFLAAE